MKKGVLWGVGVVLGVFLLGWLLILQPIDDQIQADREDIQSLSARLAQLSSSSQSQLLPKVTTVTLTAGVQRLLQTARESGVKVELLESPPAATPHEGMHLTGDGTLSAFLRWLDTLAMSQDTFQLKRVTLTALTDGRVQFGFYALPAIDSVSPKSPPAPLGNPFCHVDALPVAEAIARVPIIERYAIRDETYLGVARLGAKTRALIGVPGGGLQDVGVGDGVGEERATVVAMTDTVLRLKTQAGEVSMKREQNNNE